ncbi:MAG: MATE family efflux transporter, partial [Blautia sp.]
MEMRLDRRQFYRTVAMLVLPIALQNLINVGVTSADVIMLGRVGETSLSGVSLANQVYFILSLVYFGLTSGAAVLTAQYWGKNDVRTIERVLGISLRVGIWAGLIFTIVVLLFPVQVMRIFTNEPAVIAEGVRYLKIVAYSYVISGITCVYLSIMRSVERVIVATVVYLISLIVNVVINSILIFGLLGAPQMGSQGAAIGTLVARCTELLIVIFYAGKINDTVKVHPRDLLERDPLLM